MNCLDLHFSAFLESVQPRLSPFVNVPHFSGDRVPWQRQCGAR